MPNTLDEFLATYNGSGSHPVTIINVDPEHSPFIIVNHQGYTVLINPLGQSNHLSVDVHTFVDGEKATAGVMAMTNGDRYKLEQTGYTSHGWPSAQLVAVLVGEQGTVE